jgi:hypothetical protein
MDQLTFAHGGFELPRKPIRREAFLQDMNAIVPWRAIVCHRTALSQR